MATKNKTSKPVSNLSTLDQAKKPKSVKTDSKIQMSSTLSKKKK